MPTQGRTYTKGLTALGLAVSVVVAGLSHVAVAAPGEQLLIVSIDTSDPTMVSVIVAVPSALAVESIPSSAFSVVVGDEIVDLTSADPLPPRDLAVGLVLDDSEGVAPVLLAQQQSALVDLVRALDAGTVASVGTTSGQLLAPPSADKATMISGIAAAKPTDARASADGPPGLFDGSTRRRQIVAIDVEPRSPQPEGATDAISSVVRLYASGHATVETRPPTNLSFVPAGPSTLLVAVDEVSASLRGQYRLTGRVAVPTEGTLTVSLSHGFAHLVGKAPLPLASAPTATPTDPAPSPVVVSPATTPVTVPAAGIAPATTPAPVTSTAPPPAQRDEAASSPEVALPLQSRGAGGAIPIRTLALGGVLLVLVVAAGVILFRRATPQERVYVRVSAPYRHATRPSHSSSRSRNALAAHERRPRSSSH